jgi:uncharacterized Fe-S cluster protein YjdI
MDEPILKKYSNGEITITWEPSLCIHSTLCWRKNGGLPQVFNPKVKPWINPENADSETIMMHVDKCPSGALKYYKNEEDDSEPSVAIESIAEVMENGPLLVYGNIIVKDSAGNETRRNKLTAFCRCGASLNKPYCDGSHTKINFQG